MSEMHVLTVTAIVAAREWYDVTHTPLLGEPCNLMLYIRHAVYVMS